MEMTNKKQWVKRLLTLCLVLCLTVQSVLTNAVLPAWAGNSENFLFTGITVRDKNGVEIENGSKVSMSEPIYVRYQFSITDQAKAGELLDFQLPKEIGIYDDMTFKLVSEEDAIKFATVEITRDGKGTIRLLEASQFLNGLDGWFELETFWNAKEVGLEEDNAVKLEFEIGTAHSTVYQLHVSRPDIRASVGITKEGKAEKDGRITWTVEIVPKTEPIPFPIEDVEIVDIIDADQAYIPGSCKVSVSSGNKKTLKASFGFLNTAAMSAGGRWGNATSSNATPSNATPSDALPVFRMVEQEAKTEENYQISYAEDTRTLKCTFTKAVEEAYTLTYQTEPDGSGMFDDQYTTEAPASYQFKNTATVIFPTNGIAIDPENPGTAAAKAEVEYPLNYIEKDGQLFDSKSEIMWTVSVNRSHMNVKGAFIEDHLQSDFLKLDASRIYFDGKTLERCDEPGVNGMCSHNEASHFTYDEDSRTLRYAIGDLEGESKDLIYYTLIDDNTYGEDGKFEIENEAWLGTANGYYGKGPTVLTPLHGVIEKSGRGYDASSHQITWHITVNGQGRELSNAVMTDILSLDTDADTGANAQEYVEGSFAVKGANGPAAGKLTVTKDEYGQKQTLSYEFGNINSSYEIEFKTRLLNANDYQINKAGKYRNTAELTGTYQGKSFHAKSEGDQEITSSVLEKTGTYDHVNNIIDWTITVNRNEMPVDRAVLTDKLPENQIFYNPTGNNIKDAVSIDGVDPEAYDVSYSADERALSVAFRGEEGSPTINSRYLVHIKTQLTKEFMESEFGYTNGEIAVGNRAEFKGNNIISSQVDGEVKIENQLVGKKAYYENGDTAITWRIFLNQHRVPVKAGTAYSEVYLADDLAPGLSLDLDSIKLYKNVVINKDGSYGIDGRGEVILSEDGVKWSSSAKESASLLTFGGEDGNIRYENAGAIDGTSRFEFHFAPEPVRLSGTADDIFGGANYVLEFKTDIASSMADKKTEINNEIALNGIQADNSGSSDNSSVYFSSGMGGGSGAKPTLKVKKVDQFDPSIVLEGAAFSLKDVDTKHAPLGLQPVSAGTDKNGIAEFSRLYFNTKYELKETQEPSGYKPANDLVVDGALVLEKAMLIQNTYTVIQENTPKLGWIELQKMSRATSGFPVAGAEIVVSTDPEGRNVVKQYMDVNAKDGAPKEAKGVTGPDGKIKFTGLRCGTYYLVETKAPDGYAVSREAIRFTIPDEIEDIANYDTSGNRGKAADNGIAVATDGALVMHDEPVGRLEVKKSDSLDQQIALAGAKIALYRSEEEAKDKKNQIAVKTTDSKGIAAFDNLGAGEYWVREIQQPDHYILSAKEEENIAKVTLTVEPLDDKVTQQEIPVLRNVPVGSFQLQKQDVYSKAPIPGAEITVTATPSNSIFEPITVRTGADGVAAFKDLPFGEYTWQETKLPEGYTYCDGYNGTENRGQPSGTFTIGRDNFKTTVRAEAGNRPVLAAYTFQKTDNELEPLEGVQFKLQTADGKDIANQKYPSPSSTFLSDSDGMVTILCLRPGRYKCVEIKGVDNHEQSLVFEFTVDAKDAEGNSNDKKTITRANPAVNWRTGQFTIEKRDAVTGALITSAETKIKVWAVDNGGAQLEKQDERYYNEELVTTGGVLNLTLKAGAYKYKEIAAPAGYALDSNEYSFAAEYAAKHSATLTNKPLGTISVTKKEAGGSQKALEGAVIGLYSDAECSTLVTLVPDNAMGADVSNPKTTDKNGKVEFSGLLLDKAADKYWIKEITAPKGYLLNENPVECSFDGLPAGAVLSRVIEDEPVTVTLEVKKTDNLRPEGPVAGAVIGLYDAASDEVLQQAVTDAAGIGNFENVRYGAYYAKEIAPPTHYLIDPDQTEVIAVDRIQQNGEVISFQRTLVDVPVGSFTLTKISSVNTDEKLEGAKILLARTDAVPGEVIDTKITGPDGTVKFEQLPYGTYRWEEQEAPGGYIKGEVFSGTFTIEAPGQHEEVTLKNRPQPAFNYQIIKTGAEADGLGGRLLDGAEFGIFTRADNLLVGTVQKTQGGAAEFKGLQCGTDYYYKELTPPAGFRQDTAEHGFRVEDNGSDEVRTIQETVSNELIRGSFRLKKIGSKMDKKPVPGVTFEAEYQGRGDAGADNPTPGRTKWQETTDADGVVKFGNLPAGEYVCREIAAPPEYHLDKEWEYHFTIRVDGELVEYTDGLGNKEYANYGPYSGSLELTKKDSDTLKPLEGAVIGVFLASNGTKAAEGITDSQGRVTIAPLYGGDYYYQEIKAPYGYALEDTRHMFSINPGSETVSAVLTNTKLITGTLEVHKVGEDGKPLAGAEIGLYKTGNVLIESKITGADGRAVFENLNKDEQAQYYYRELQAPRGYVLDESMHPFEFHISEAGQIVKAILENTKIHDTDDSDDSGHTGESNRPQGNTDPTEQAGTGTPKPEEPSEPGIPQLPQDEERQPVAPDSDGGWTITVQQTPPGTMITITDSEEDEVFRGRSDESRQVHVVLAPGNYTVFAIDDEGVPLVSMPITIEEAAVPLAAADVGDHGIPVSLLAAVMLAALAGAGSLAAVRMGAGRKKKEDE